MRKNKNRAPSAMVLAEAKRILALPDCKNDSWYAYGPYWDINLLVDDQGQRSATIYPVYKGNTDTSQPYPVMLD